MNWLRPDGAVMTRSTDRMNRSGKYAGMKVELLEVSLAPPLRMNYLSRLLAKYDAASSLIASSTLFVPMMDGIDGGIQYTSNLY
jgi:hypothetical protein